MLRPSSDGNLLHLPITTRVRPAATMQIAMHFKYFEQAPHSVVRLIQPTLVCTT